MAGLLALVALLAPARTVDVADPAVVVGAPVPWFAGWTADDQVLNRTALLKRADARGFVVVVVATWCAPCAAGLRRLAAARARLADAGLQLVLIAHREHPAVVQPWLAAQGVAPEVPVIYDRFGRASASLGAERDQRVTLPRTVVFDAAGVVRAVLGVEGADYEERVLGALGPGVTPPRPRGPDPSGP
ncbi:MAG: redoxin domain-containing protein [Myxococcales bacterium]|nr:redoxin domain-containing protein [Myxococcales bacterium]